MMKDAHVAVIVRTFSRIRDVEDLLHLIRTRWTSCRYTVFVAHNGESSGYPATQVIREGSYYVQVENNEGHIYGARSLVRAGFEAARAMGGFTHYLFIESDFWLLDDSLIGQALCAMRDGGRGVASTIWVERARSLAVDFFIVEAGHLHAHPELLDWDAHPERYLGAVIPEDDVHIIRQLRCVHLPGVLRFLPLHRYLIDGNRFRIFKDAPALTHHWETLDHDEDTAMAIKEGLANSLVPGCFPGVDPVALPFGLSLPRLSLFVPQSYWFKGRKHYQPSA